MTLSVGVGFGSVVAGASPPAAPSSLVATAVSPSRVDLAWTDNSDNETAFHVERSPDGSTWAEIDTTAENIEAYADTGLTASSSYHYRVRAFNTAGYSSYSNTDSAVTQDSSTLIRVPGDNEPLGMTKVWVLDVTQADQDILNPTETMDNYTSRWTNPAVSPRYGAYFAKDDGTYQHMEFVWPATTTGDERVARAALAENSFSTTYDEIYFRWIFQFDGDYRALSANKFWYFGWVNPIIGYANSATPPMVIDLANLTGKDPAVSNIITAYFSGEHGNYSTHFSADTWHDLEVHCVANTASTYDGSMELFVDDVQITPWAARYNNWPATEDIWEGTTPNNCMFDSQGRGFGSIQVGPYQGGQTASPYDKESVLRCACFYISGK